MEHSTELENDDLNIITEYSVGTSLADNTEDASATRGHDTGLPLVEQEAEVTLEQNQDAVLGMYDTTNAIASVTNDIISTPDYVFPITKDYTRKESKPNNPRKFQRSRTVPDSESEDEDARPCYRANRSQTDVDLLAQEEEVSEDVGPPVQDLGHFSGMGVEITQTEQFVAPQRLPEGLRYVMMHVIGSRPSEEVKFRRLKYKLEKEVLPFGQLKATKSHRPQATARRPLRPQRSYDATSTASSTAILHPATVLPAQQSAYASICHTQIEPTPGPVPTHPVVKPELTGLRNSTSRQKGVLVVLAMNDLMTSMSLSILAPFFPKEARQKGISEAISGWVFGIFALFQCLASPVFGHLLPRVGAKFLSQAGMFFAGGCTILFGLLQYVSTEDNGILFISYCFMLRMFMAVGCAANGTSAFAIAARTFPDNPATVFGLLETAVGFGLMLGPAIGGVLYEVGGFVAPFVAIGVVMIVTLPISLAVLPKDLPETMQHAEDNVSIRQFLRVPGVTVTAMAAFIACMSWMMPDPVLEPHLSKFELSPTIIGLVFLLMAACYAVCSPVWGWVADNVEDSAPLMVIGFTGTGVGFLLLGPSPIFRLPDNFEPLWLDIIALIVIGLSISLALVPTYDKILDAAEKAGIPDTLANCSTVAGMWNASYSFGEFVGPVLSGWLMGRVGFAWTMSLASSFCIFMAIVMLMLYLYEKKFGPAGVIVQSFDKSSENSPSERTPLLPAPDC